VSVYSFLDPAASYPLPKSFDYSDYIETERELWALFPQTEGQRVNFCQTGLTAQIFVQSHRDGTLEPGETYFLMPCPDRKLRPLRMSPVRRLTRDEFRMTRLTGARMADKLADAADVMDAVHLEILGPEVAEY
jgi:hypothetical protein